MRRVLLAILGTAAIAMLPTASASAGRPASGWGDELSLSNAVEAHGFTYRGRHVPVDSAYCQGLRRYGVQARDYQDYFHRFKCSANGADNHSYTLQVTIVNGTPGGRYYWQAVSASRDF